MAGLGLATIKRVSKDDDANSERKNQKKRQRRMEAREVDE